MNVDTARLIEYNMVVVFRDLRFGQILSELARRLLPEHPSPLITEIPNQLLAVVYPDRQIECQFANRRVQVTDKRRVDPGEHPFPLIASNAIDAAVQSSGRDIAAYGYNYVVHLQENAPAQYIASRFFQNADVIAEAVGGQLTSIGFTAQAHVPQEGCLLSINLGPVPNTQDLIQATVNYHYEGQSPADAALAIGDQVAALYKRFVDALHRL